ncbi:uncharacterized protein LOC143915571 [Arctopsyche grandis]|uniref:uncharacterized protein LOC143915571 n=1 Tax=Arctopsyche grandis TaxID=121162 RepID=UPI00406D7C19
MECRLCLCFAPVESSMSIYDNSHPLVQRIWTCCQLHVTRDDRLPDTVCFSCVNNLEFFSNFRNVCLKSDEALNQRLVERLDIKMEKRIIEDLSSKNESAAILPPNICNPPVNNKINEWKSNAIEGCGSNQNIHSIENINAPIRERKVTLCDYGAAMICEIGISPEETNAESKLRLHQKKYKSEFQMDSTTITYEHSLNVGQTFINYEELTKVFNAFCKQYHHPFVIRTRSDKQIVYKCRHGVRQSSKSQGKRPNQHYFYQRCGAQINLYKGKNNNWKVTKVLLDHNHTVGKEEFSFYGKGKRLSEIDYDTVTGLFISGTQNEMIAKNLTDKSGKSFTRKDIQNFRSKLLTFESRG